MAVPVVSDVRVASRREGASPPNPLAWSLSVVEVQPLVEKGLSLKIRNSYITSEEKARIEKLKYIILLTSSDESLLQGIDNRHIATAIHYCPSSH
ncbi:MAG: hypothetical protein RM368_06920 [Nostoc sp. DedSLP03]|uniref:hypothetical protein n=1 Tax=Nostoc sp. DedSLP03 TaxID=3075400 RepID=UPI002AD24F96|nr:hypothetical protein [Nostoc sp. DedSLP03]MDZ7964695.1 hypothetical protein [Nostoc sp. DedSLP03]